MTEHPTFETRLQDAFNRYLADAPTAIDAPTLAATTIRGGLRTVRGPRIARPVRSARFFLVAAVLLLAAALVAASAGGLFRGRLAVAPSLTASALPSVGPAATLASGAPAWDAIYLREHPAAPATVDVIAVRPDGSERLIRSIPADFSGGDGRPRGGTVSSTGWLFLYNVTSADAAGYVDLAHPASQVQFVSFHAPLGPRWSSTGLLAVPGYGPGRNSAYQLWSRITILDPITGATTDLGSLGLFGGGPSIAWAADGSGILDGGRLKPVDGGNDVAVDPNLPFDDPRLGVGASTVLNCRPDINSDCPTTHGSSVKVAALLGSGPVTQWWSTPEDTFQPMNAYFGADGRTLLVAFEDTSTTPHRAVIGRLSAPDQLTTIATWDLPAGAFMPAMDAAAPDGSLVLLSYATGSTTDPQIHAGPALAGGLAFAQPEGYLAGWVPGPIAESWPAAGGFGQPSTSPLP